MDWVYEVVKHEGVHMLVDMMTKAFTEADDGLRTHGGGMWRPRARAMAMMSLHWAR